MMICFEAGDVTFNYRAAGIILRGHEVLLQTIGDEEFWCLPGGRVELLESGEEAIRRELREELGMEVEVQRLVWVVENLYEHKGHKYHEASLYFLAALPEDSPEYHARAPWTGREEDGTPLLFQWHSISLLTDVNLMPSFLRTRLRNLPENIQYIVHRDT